MTRFGDHRRAHDSFSQRQRSAQPPGPPPPPAPLDAAGRTAVVKAAAEALRQRYVYPDVGKRAAEAIEAALAAGKYDEIVQPWAFAERLTADLARVAHDKHMRVSARGPAPVPAAATGGPPPGPPPRSEAGVTRADRLPDNIGYIEVVALPGLDAFKPPVDKAMAALADTRALIIDLRRNGGGAPQAEVYLDELLLDPRSPSLSTRSSRAFRAPRRSTPRVHQLADAVLVSRQARLRADERANLLGRRSRRLRHAGTEARDGRRRDDGRRREPRRMSPLTPDFAMFMPGGRGESPITGTNWEGVGVKPDVAVSAADALKAALGLLGHTTDKTEIDALSEARLFEPR